MALNCSWVQVLHQLSSGQVSFAAKKWLSKKSFIFRAFWISEFPVDLWSSSHLSYFSLLWFSLYLPASDSCSLWQGWRGYFTLKMTTRVEKGDSYSKYAFLIVAFDGIPFHSKTCIWRTLWWNPNSFFSHLFYSFLITYIVAYS